MIAEDLSPFPVRLVRCEDDRLCLIPAQYQLEEGVSTFGAEWEVSDLIHNQQLRLREYLDALKNRTRNPASRAIIPRAMAR